MRTICDACESAAAVLFCAADEAALCRSCDDKVHMCNKLASRHVRVGLADPSEVPRCDICEKAPAFFYCEIDGTSLCLQCDMIVHVGGKRTHGRYLLLRQRVEFPGDKQVHRDDVAMQSNEQVETRRDQYHVAKPMMEEKMQNHKLPVAAVPLFGANNDDHGKMDAKTGANNDDHGKMDAKMIDLNTRPYRNLGQGSNSRSQGMSHLSGSNNKGS